MRAWIVGGACLGVAATAFGGLIASGAGDDPSADRTPTATEIPAATSEPDRLYFVTPGPPPGDPRPLTAQECIDARPRMEAQVNLRRPKVAALGSAELARFDAAVADSRAWFDAGCPPHETLGYYPWPDGSGAQIVLIDF